MLMWMRTTLGPCVGSSGGASTAPRTSARSRRRVTPRPSTRAWSSAEFKRLGRGRARLAGQPGQRSAPRHRRFYPLQVEALTFEAYCRDVRWPIHGPRVRGQEPQRAPPQHGGRDRPAALRARRRARGAPTPTPARVSRSAWTNSVRTTASRPWFGARAWNGRTAVVNARRVGRGRFPVRPVTLEEESACKATLRAFFVTLNVIIAWAKGTVTM